MGETGLPRRLAVDLARRELAVLRETGESVAFEQIVERLGTSVAVLCRSRLQPVLNATGIIVHTNLGRSPLGRSAVELVAQVASSYTNLEYDLSGGERGDRAAYLEHALEVLVGYPSTVVNNCAAALVLILKHFCVAPRNRVVISRGELVQIGGGFRIPDILDASGAELREVGTTNKTSARDYAKGIDKRTALVLKVHRSNFFMGGFVESATREEIAKAAKSKRVPVVEDLGSGSLLSDAYFPGAEHEPTPAEVLKAGADLVCFSGDKLLGGPQAGIIAGKKKLIHRLKREPLFRALRCDKLTMAALQATVDTYLSQSAGTDLPILRMMQTPIEELRVRAEAIVAALSSLPLKANIAAGKGQVGGGTLPKSVLASVTIDLIPSAMSVDALATRLRHGAPPVIAYVANGRVRLDLRTIFPDQDADLIRAVVAAVKPLHS